MTYPLGTPSWMTNHAVNYAYDAASELSSVSAFGAIAIGVTHTVDGLSSALTLGNSGVSINSPSSITLTNGSTLQEFSYSDEPSGAIAET